MAWKFTADTLPPQMKPKGASHLCAYCHQEFYRRPSHDGLYCSRKCEGAGRRVPLAERFWVRVEKTGGLDACWPWMGYRNPDGYGQVGSYTLAGKKRMFLTNRVAWELTNGPIPEGKSILHSCDNPPCCNPRHLSPGTKLENNREAKRKGRKAVGEKSGSARLSHEQVNKIRERYATGDISQHALGREYGVTAMTINRLVRHISWQGSSAADERAREAHRRLSPGDRV